jgi:hypothetical protein
MNQEEDIFVKIAVCSSLGILWEYNSKLIVPYCRVINIFTEKYDFGPKYGHEKVKKNLAKEAFNYKVQGTHGRRR